MTRVHRSSSGLPGGREPIREEVASSERMEQIAAELAREHGGAGAEERGGRSRSDLARRLRENGRVLLESYRAIGEAVRVDGVITPAAEWLVDNFHLVEDQLREIRDDLPPGYYRQLPKLATGQFRGYPRVLALVWAFVAHTDSRFENEPLQRFVLAYQRVRPLSIGELWAVPITLRFVLVENLRRLAETVVRAREARREADALADRLLGLEREEEERTEAAIPLSSYERKPLEPSFVVTLVHRLRGLDPQTTPVAKWLDERLAVQRTSADEIVQSELQLQAALNATVRNVITSMRLISACDWCDFIESVSLVDELLRSGSAFAEMDFATRDRYRHAIEELARGSGRAELQVAREALRLARLGAGGPKEPQRAARGQAAGTSGNGGASEDAAAGASWDGPAAGPASPTPPLSGDQLLAEPGYYLISRGRERLEREIGYRMVAGHRVLRAFVRHATGSYLGAIGLGTLLLLALPVAVQVVWSPAGSLSRATLIALALAAVIPASDLAIALVNRWVTKRFPPRLQPKLDLAGGIPPALRTLVVMPVLLTGAEEIAALLEQLEVHFLANADPELRFALLSDWTDAPAETVAGDEELVRAAQEGIAELNRRYGPASGGCSRFLLLHRRRVWSAGEGCWMGWERKRGKLHELNRLLRGAPDTSFLSGAAEVPAGVRYVITLDADTRLPRGAARRLVAAMAHPLNRPRFDEGAGRVVEGYAILQPRTTPTLPSGHQGSLFQRIFSGPAGIDFYSAAASDVYQDLFGEGSYTGKGIYDVDPFEQALAGKIPDNSMLSHDLFEGIFARAGLVSEIELFEEFPAHYLAASARQHRWARGDWQLLPWLAGRGPGREPARMPAIARWKMLDNLRRSLSAPAALLTLLAAWTLHGAAPLPWTLFVVAVLGFPPFFSFLAGLVPVRSGISKRSHLLGLADDLVLAINQAVLGIALLPHQAWLMADAIGRTLWRLYVTRRRLLEWVTAAQAKADLAFSVALFCRAMAGGLALAVAAGLLVALAGQPAALLSAVPFLLLWVFAPLLALAVSRPPAAAEVRPLRAGEVLRLRLIARRTWRFFETFVGAEDHFLPPDNFQEDPRPMVAHRTSPTNLGLYLLAVTAAHDLGWIGLSDCVSRLEATLATMSGLALFRGHLYNWYETRELRPLEPRYVSTVDSGNLAGHLLVLAQTCRRDRVETAARGRALAGLGDALALARDAVPAAAADGRSLTVTRKQLVAALAALQAALSPADLPDATADAAAWEELMARLAQEAHIAADMARAMAREQAGGSEAEAWNEVLDWTERAEECVASHLRDRVARAGSPPSATAAGHELDLAARAELPVSGRAEAAATGAGPAPAGGSGSLEGRLAKIARRAEEMFAAMEFGFLYDPARRLFSIGYQVVEGRLDGSYYDLLASEARLASFVAIAKGDVAASHWFQLGRPLTPVARGSALISWSGSMFEYLMPQLTMRAPANSLIDQTCRLVVRRQIEYGRERGLPWGVSESAFNARDLDLVYQYSNFGVPGLGLKRGLSDDAVVAPYATALAAMVEPEAALLNFAHLERAGAGGRHGFYEALDYTASRLPAGESVAVVRTYMAHHQGMSLIALANTLDVRGDGAMPARFHSLPIVEATELLLQERTPRDVEVARPRAEEVAAAASLLQLAPPLHRRFPSPHSPSPRTHLLSNRRYVVMMTAAGSGYSRWQDLAITRWQEDVTCDCWGSYCFLRDIESGAVWSAGYQPRGIEPESYEAVFVEDRVEILRQDKAITTRLDVVVAAEHDAEVRRVSLSNLGARAREIEVTSYAELVLAPAAADTAHPAFSKLFVETELVAASGTLLATRRPRAQGEQQLWAAHVCAVEGDGRGALQFETDRARFLGRGRGIRTPMSVIDGRPLSNTTGAVLDPIFCLRRRVRIPPGGSARLTFTTLVAPSREEVLSLADRYRDGAAYERAATMAWTQAQVQLRHLGINSDQAHLFQRLANRVLYSDPTLRPPTEVLQRGVKPPPSLWPHGISGDLPVVLAVADLAEDVSLIRQLLQAHEYWGLKHLEVDLVILNEKATTYAQDLQATLEAMVRTRRARWQAEAPAPRGQLFVLRADQLSAETRLVLQAVARAVLRASAGSLAEQIALVQRAEPQTPQQPARPAPARAAREAPPARRELEFFNGLGGFAEGGSEYVTILGEGQWTPAPWVNVVANPSFGFMVSESGGGYTWALNSRENQLTPWSNDPVSDPPGEVIYVRDEASGELWGPTLLPIREDPWSYVAAHGQGYSRFSHVSHGVSLELLQFVPTSDPVKISRLRLENLGGAPRRLSVTAYVEWVLGSSRGAAAPFIVTARDGATGALLASNAWNRDFGKRVAFADLAGKQTAWTGDRTEFLGRHGTLDHPAALERGQRLSGRVGAGQDPCAALQSVVELRARGSAEIVFLLGQGSTAEEARELIARYRSADLEAVLAEVRRSWEDVLAPVQVRTPDRSMDILLNRWLLYQTLACRVWARTAFYQASGAYGFRDQLQDVMALTVARREVAREHILLAASRQFVKGDVQHWWHPPAGRGVRTRIADDRVWLPYAVLHYLEVTGDLGVLDEQVPFLDGPELAPDQDDSYFEPAVAAESAPLFEHCARALDMSLPAGPHRLPLMGTGDWNDGMNRVGRGGRGESVWLGWFLRITLWDFARIAEARGDERRALAWRSRVEELERALEEAAWDGDWYRRAYFDDGTPLGSAANDECRIDSIAQSWAVLAGPNSVAARERATRAMAAVEEYLVRRGDGLVLLFAPPFDRTALDPGYIKGYVPGVRENGGQYTHAAIWCILAFAALADGNKAGELFSILNPINHSRTRAGIHRYKVEPYVTAGDIYAGAGHLGRGGWTWYSGSAGWMYRAGLEWILGFRLRGATLWLDPCIPREWRGFEIAFRYHSARYAIAVENPHAVTRGVASVERDGEQVPVAEGRVARVDLEKEGEHRVKVVLG